MTARLSLNSDPAAYRAMRGLEDYLAGTSLPRSTLELIKLRASQINGCAFCVDMHAHDMRDAGETDQRLFSVVTWREAPFFTEAERAALELTEAATRLDTEGVPDTVWDAAAEHYDDKQLVAVVTAIATINAWNRIAITARSVPAKRA
ncbi:carboxymuconolactone decarboxylase family protein [Allosaccharopolyspora coralli]|uniref:Carboxymuconolactone decarboxylase family protein n=1 Tax=Allosaccharopolyspora coralli TaxID=2665642 RepID=A0A5Q3QK37_9PSEU|nr:carboxymuconolactone decarboxylase family protein [Allosaccharopolyspora coralli]QGK71809.1 carboxymuconolactone decarboxylase family protein [Allosaccharopolyspora coralli]